MNIKKNILGFVIGGVVAGTVGVIGANILSSQLQYNPQNSISYGATNSIDSVDKAIDDLYTKVGSLPNKRYLDGEIVYYNPVTDSVCSDYHADNSLTNYKADAASKTTDNQTGCLRWFAYKDTNASSTVKLLLDHNTTAIVQWYSSDTYKTYDQSLVKPYVDKLGYTVANGGSGWAVTPSLIDATDIADIIGYNTIRKGTMWNSANSNNTFYFETGTTSGGISANQSSSPYKKSRWWWLYDNTYNCQSYGCEVQDQNSYTDASSGASSYAYGYWTKTNIGSGSTVWIVHCYGSLNYNFASNSYRGVRPVITVEKSKL